MPETATRTRPMSTETLISMLAGVFFLIAQGGGIIWYFRGQQSQIEMVENRTDWQGQQITKVLTLIETLDSIVLRVASAETQIAKAEEQLQVLHEIRTQIAVMINQQQNMADDMQDIKKQVVPMPPQIHRRNP
jgi:hypothetical protein